MPPRSSISTSTSRLLFFTSSSLLFDPPLFFLAFDPSQVFYLHFSFSLRCSPLSSFFFFFFFFFCFRSLIFFFKLGVALCSNRLSKPFDLSFFLFHFNQRLPLSFALIICSNRLSISPFFYSHFNQRLPLSFALIIPLNAFTTLSI